MTLSPNPIIVKELRSRMRGPRAFLVLTGMLLFLGGATYGLYWIVMSSYGYSPMLSPNIGQTLFIGLALLELLIISFITPAVTAGAVSSEREKLTYEMLLTTPLSPGSILWGKLIAALSYVLLLIFAAVPLASLVFIFGGVAPWEMLKALIVLVSVAVMLGVVGLFFSVWFGRSGRATILSYLFVLVLFGAPLVIYILVAAIRQGIPPRWILIPNPMSVLFSAILPAISGQVGMGGIFQGLGMALGGNLEQMNGMTTGVPRPLYHYGLPLYAIFTLILYLLSTRLIQPIRRWRLSWASVGIAVGLLLAVGGGTALTFVSTADRYTASALPTPAPFAAMAMAAPAPPAVAVARVEARPIPTSTPSPLPTPLPPLGELTADDPMLIYTVVAVHLLQGESEPPPERLYLVRRTFDVMGYIGGPSAPSEDLPSALQSVFADAIPSLNGQVIWIDEWPDSTIELGEEDRVLMLGNLHPVEGGILASATLFSVGERSTGGSYLLTYENDNWTLTGEPRATWGK
ncbi:MAG: ABC transporter permease [Caldilineaceae bacterium]|nr:ABC transporter permease [Caldilineaceae bacterium]